MIIMIIIAIIINLLAAFFACAMIWGAILGGYFLIYGDRHQTRYDQIIAWFISILCALTFIVTSFIIIKEAIGG